MNEFLSGVTLCMFVHPSVCFCASNVCVCQLMNPPELKWEAPTLLQDNFTAAVNLQESHQCVSECV